MGVHRVLRPALRGGRLFGLALLTGSVWAWLCAEPHSTAAFVAFIGTVVGGVWFSARSFQGLFGRLVFPLRVLKTLTGLGRERQSLYQAALAIRRRQEERAFALLEPLAARGAPDVRAAAHPALRHRLILSFEGQAEGIAPDQIVDKALEAVRE